MNKNDVFLDKVPMRNTSNCLYVCRTLDYVAKHRTGFSPPTLDEPPSWHSHYITPRALPLPYCRLASGLSSVSSFRFYSSSDSLVWIQCLDSRLFSLVLQCRSVVPVIVSFQTARSVGVRHQSYARLIFGLQVRNISTYHFLNNLDFWFTLRLLKCVMYVCGITALS